MMRLKFAKDVISKSYIYHYLNSNKSYSQILMFKTKC